MFIEVVTLTACVGAGYQAYRGTSSSSAKIGMFALIACTIIQALF